MTTGNWDDQVRELVLNRFPAEEYKVFMYGSRATGKAKKWSDYDVGVMGNERLVPKDRLVALRGDLEESSLPVLVDVVDFNKVNDDFKKVAMEKVVWWS